MGILFCFFKRKTAYEMRISDWSSDVCSSDLAIHEVALPCIGVEFVADRLFRPLEGCGAKSIAGDRVDVVDDLIRAFTESRHSGKELAGEFGLADRDIGNDLKLFSRQIDVRSEGHTSELQSLMRISYAVFCLTKHTPQ